MDGPRTTRRDVDQVVAKISRCSNVASTGLLASLVLSENPHPPGESGTDVGPAPRRSPSTYAAAGLPWTYTTTRIAVAGLGAPARPPLKLPWSSARGVAPLVLSITAYPPLLSTATSSSELDDTRTPTVLSPAGLTAGMKSATTTTDPGSLVGPPESPASSAAVTLVL